MKVNSISDLPNEPAVYAMYGGSGSGLHVAYVGIAGKLRQRVRQHLIRRDSSVTTGASVASLDPDKVTQVRWWTAEAFGDRDALKAAELVAFDALEPVLRSRGHTSDAACELYSDPAFREKIEAKLNGGSDGRLVLHTLDDALEKIERLEGRVRALEKKIEKLMAS